MFSGRGQNILPKKDKKVIDVSAESVDEDFFPINQSVQ